MIRIVLIATFLFANLLWGQRGSQLQRQTFTVRGTLEVPAGQADGSDNPDCPPAKCGWVIARGIRPTTPGCGYACCDIRTFVGDYECKKVTSPTKLNQIIWWDCGDHYARFYGPYNLEGDPDQPVGSNLGRVRVQFRNWAHHSQTASILVSFAAPPVSRPQRP